MISFVNSDVSRPRGGESTLSFAPGHSSVSLTDATSSNATPVEARLPRLPLLTNTRGILVSGSHRSGTTWVGRMLANAPGVDYIHEPFKPGWSLPYTFTRSDLWFPYISQHNESQWITPVRKTLTFNYSWGHTYREAPGIKQAVKATNKWARWTARKFRGRRPLIKDPIALFAAPWLADRFGVSMVMMIRHPAAFVSSIKLKNWVFDWSHWHRQTELMQTLLAPFAAEVAHRVAHRDDIVDQAILQWRIFHHVIDLYRKQRPDWHYVRHEDLSMDPVQGYRAMFAHCGLAFTPACEHAVRTSTDEGNIKDANAAGKSTHYVQLDAKANVKNWQRRLTPDEIARIRRGTEDISPLFYNDSDWA